MTKAAIIAARKRFESVSACKIGIMTDENVNFNSRDSYLLWNDDEELLLIINPQQNTIESSDKKYRGELIVTEYDKIVYMSAIPDLSKIDTWLPEFVKGTDADINRIKNSFKQITNDDYYV